MFYCHAINWFSSRVDLTVFRVFTYYMLGSNATSFKATYFIFMIYFRRYEYVYNTADLIVSNYQSSEGRRVRIELAGFYNVKCTLVLLTDPRQVER